MEKRPRKTTKPPRKNNFAESGADAFNLEIYIILPFFVLILEHALLYSGHEGRDDAQQTSTKGKKIPPARWAGLQKIPIYLSFWIMFAAKLGSFIPGARAVLCSLFGTLADIQQISIRAGL